MEKDSENLNPNQSSQNNYQNNRENFNNNMENKDSRVRIISFNYK